MVIRPAELADVPGILAIYNEAVLNSTATADEQPQPLEQRLAWFRAHQRDGFPMLVAEEGGEVVGWSSLSRYHLRVAYRFTAEDSVYIHPAWRGQGIGRALLLPLLAQAPTMGLHSVMALIEAGNQASLRLHASLGFEQVGLAPEVMYKFGEWLDLALLQRRFEPDGRK